ncbi:serine-threonine protein kinase, putative [Entamoeba invadens IP1]|uniref:serine-threonine protein kinase, putative n=1 Tax=Entamoeba invadens IP1 TaxID=370355 RepID=UPI0002C3D5E7|nr:serine-threonine protein kinase, putative [Entamoeba invadens IP1]ELP90424.1 serine-threonine protein kinase, putative [Entamoeba invadens IP1]|eukprot:XP_004257195.1 serine-threonine protein kinase, putative [Entamoeba invadens IP1]
MFTLIVMLLFKIVVSFLCSPGCKSGCIADYTCLGNCSELYEQDTSCQYCQFTNPYDGNDVTFLMRDGVCYKNTNVVETIEWLPKEINISEMTKDETYTFRITKTGTADHSPCYYKQKYRLARWFKINLNQFTEDHFLIHLSKPNKDNVTLFFDGTNSQRSDVTAKCSIHVAINDTDTSVEIRAPIVRPTNTVEGSDVFYYFFASVDDYYEVDVSVTVSEANGVLWDPYFNITQKEIDPLLKDLNATASYTVPFESSGHYGYLPCFTDFYAKVVIFTASFFGEYSMRFDSRANNRVNHLVEFSVEEGANGELTYKCIKGYEGVPIGALAEYENSGFVAKIKGDVEGTRNFAVASEDPRSNIQLEITALCINDCHYLEGHGKCLTTDGICKCEDKYGGEDCRLKCYYEGQWLVPEKSNLCYFGSQNCDDDCLCKNGELVINHLCTTEQCRDGGMGDGDECPAEAEGCSPNCMCFAENGYNADGRGKCINRLCGNRKIDTYYEGSKFIRTEECDSGTNCDSQCRCVEGFVPDPTDPLSCVVKSISSGAIAGIVVTSVIVFIFILGLISLLLYFALRYKKADVSIYKQQQPTYHFYITGSKRDVPSKQSGYYIDPVNLDYGNTNQATEIFDTRFERMEVKNFSKNKYLMIIFHTPNSPKYVFYFDPQVVIIGPHSPMKTITSFLTLHCTCKIRELKIPYTVWFSKSLSTLKQIAELLKGKDFDLWNTEDQNQMDKLYKNVRRHFHNYITIKTDASSSTHIDMDELNISESPIAEGAMGKVFIGNYRSVPVAIKQFRWDNLTVEEMKELKNSVVSECEIMSRLRNPFIANYMGAVTYLPQVSMVIQFFILGSLGEYIRPTSRDYVKLPYRVKVKMMFDAARGMRFLHENKIMHLDFKPDNLLVNSLDANSACSVKITDFGTSRFVKKSNLDEKGLGTPVYAAPETFHDEYTNAGDVYSFGVTAWEIFHEEEPYKEMKSVFEIKGHVEKGLRLAFDNKVPELLKFMITECWKPEPSERPNFDNVIKMIVRVDDDIVNHLDLDSGVSEEKIEEIIEQRVSRIKSQFNELTS